MFKTVSALWTKCVRNVDSRLPSLLAFAGVVLCAAKLRADIPPPPPELPYVGMEVPHPVSLMVAGLALAAAAVLAGRAVAGKSKNHWVRISAGIFALLLLLVTVISAGWATRLHAEHQERVRKYEPPGPVDFPEPSPVDGAEPDEISADSTGSP